jgi:hypothetical protein
MFYQSAFTTDCCHGASRDYYLGKRAEGKNVQQAVIALGRHRATFLWAMLRDGRPLAELKPAPA